MSEIDDSVALIEKSGLFDKKWYLSEYPDVALLEIDPIKHYLKIGARLNRKPSANFDENICSGSDDTCTNPLVDFIQSGGSLVNDSNNSLVLTKESIHFDAEFYYEDNPDVAAAGVDAYSHYINNGEREGRKPNRFFDPSFYSRINADVRAGNISPFTHYCEFGYYEGRTPCSPVANRECSSDNKPLLFIGHDGVQAGSEIVLLEVIKWFYFHTNRKLKTLLLSPGPVADLYVQYSDVYVLPQYEVDDAPALAKYISDGFEFAYLNTVVSGRTFKMMEEHGITLNCDIVTHIHEMEKVLETFSEEMTLLQKYTNHWISASPASTETLLGKYCLSENSVTTVPAFIQPVVGIEGDGLELRECARTNLGLSQDAFVIAGCGTVYWRKGPDIFLDTARNLMKKTDQKIEFVWFGEGPDRYDLMESLSEQELEYVHFVGARSDANELLAVADIFFLSSREDPFPLVVMEAAQHGVPTVCFEKATGITTFIKDDAGITLPAMDATLAAESMAILLDDREKLSRLGACAKERVFGQYTADKQCLNIYCAIQKHTTYKPSVSVIVPFYNHEKFAEERVDSILNQKIKDIEILFMDDASTDETTTVLHKYETDSRVAISYSDDNSGSPFKQWNKGVIAAKSDIIWVAEGDDSCDENFLETLLPYFDDPMMAIASAKTEIINEEGILVDNALKPYLDSAYPDKFDESYVKDGFIEVNESFGAMCTLVNASGLLIRKSALDSKVLDEAGTFKMCGDWLVYLAALRKGKVAYDVCTRNYFRRHSSSQVHKIEGSEVYFKERENIANYVFQNFRVNSRLRHKINTTLTAEWDRFKYKHPSKSYTDIINIARLEKNITHQYAPKTIAFYVHGMLFSKGGIERLAADLANYFVELGWSVVLYCREWKDSKSVYPLYESIKIRGIFNEEKLDESIKLLRKDIVNSEIEVFIPMLSEWLFTPIVEAAQNTGARIIASEHNNPWKIEELWWNKEERNAVFSKVDKIHLLANAYKASVKGAIRDKVVVIPNGVEVKNVGSEVKRSNVILAVGRLAPQKRFDRLINACALIRDLLIDSDYRIHIYGTGQLENELRDLILERQLEDIIVLKGNTNGMDQVMMDARIYAQPSEFEGQSIAALEALSNGLPIVAFSECVGMDDLVDHGANGFLIKNSKDEKEFAGYLQELILNDRKCSDFSQCSSIKASHFSKEAFLDGWYRLLATP